MAGKKYAEPDYYEAKLKRVMERFGITEFDWNWDRHVTWIEFHYKGEPYRFDYSVEKARANGEKISYGSDAFAQLVLGLEDLARVVGRGIYDLRTWISGMRYLPPPITIPQPFKILGFTEMPSSAREVDTRYRTLVKQYHPDNPEQAGVSDDFETIKRAAEQAKRHFEAPAQQGGTV